MTRPWCLSLGRRIQFENDVFLKLTTDLARVEFGDDVFVGRGVEFDVSDRVTVGESALIAPGVFITDHSHVHRKGLLIASQGCIASPVQIGADVWVGANAVILAGVQIGDGAIIGAGAVVTGNVDANAIYAGIPARKIADRLP